MSKFEKRSGQQAILAVLMFGLTTACSQESPVVEVETTQPAAELTGGELQADSAPAEARREINWAEARQARIDALDAGEADSGLVQVQAGGTGSPVPVLLPSGIVMPQDASPFFVTMEDGYFARYPGSQYDIIVNGTNVVYDAPSADMGETAREDMVFRANEAGAQVSFSRFGADYLIEFECRVLNGEDNCITEDAAIEMAEKLFVAATD